MCLWGRFKDCAARRAAAEVLYTTTGRRRGRAQGHVDTPWKPLRRRSGTAHRRTASQGTSGGGDVPGGRLRCRVAGSAHGVLVAKAELATLASATIVRCRAGLYPAGRSAKRSNRSRTESTVGRLDVGGVHTDRARRPGHGGRRILLCGGAEARGGAWRRGCVTGLGSHAQLCSCGTSHEGGGCWAPLGGGKRLRDLGVNSAILGRGLSCARKLGT